MNRSELDQPLGNAPGRAPGVPTDAKNIYKIKSNYYHVASIKAVFTCNVNAQITYYSLTNTELYIVINSMKSRMHLF